MITYNAKDWFWQIGEDASRFWSSASTAYVSQAATDQVTRIASEDELCDVLRQYGLEVPQPTEDDYQTAIQSLIDQTARSHQYGDGNSLAGYVSSTVPTWAAEAATFIAWRDRVWIYSYSELAKVQAGQRSKPSVAQIVSELPSIAWPNT
jgi:hypothetical protein